MVAFINQTRIREQGLQLPDGAIEIKQPIVLADCDGMTIRGRLGTRLIYTGPPTAGVIQLQRCCRCVLKNLEIVVAARGVEAAVLLTNLPGSNADTGRVSTGCRLKNVRVMHGGHQTAAKRAFSIDSYAVDGLDGNNDIHTLTNCEAQSYSEAGYYVRGSQCHQLLFDRCAAHDHGGRRPIGLYCEEGAYFVFRDGNMVNNAVDFKFNRFEIQHVIENFNSEHSNQFLVTGRSGGESVLAVSNVRWDGEPIDGKPVVDCFGPGPFTLERCLISGINGVCPWLRFDNYSSAHDRRKLGSVDLRSVTLRQHGGTIPRSMVDIPKDFEARRFGCSHVHIGADGSQKRTTLEESGR